MSLVKKLTLSVAILAITTGSALAADATITVKGLLVPSGCSLGIIEGNTLDFGTQAVDQLTDASNNLPMIKESQLKVDCPTDMYVALRTNHLNAADESKVKTLSNGNPTIINTADGRTVDLTLGSSKIRSTHYCVLAAKVLEHSGLYSEPRQSPLLQTLPQLKKC